MRRLRLAVTALTLLCLAANPAGADPEITKTYAYFTIGGLNGAELERELSKHGPVLTGTGIRHPGATRIELGGSVDYRQVGDGECVDCAAPGPGLPNLFAAWKKLFLGPSRNGSTGPMCYVTKATVRLETQLTLPQWKNRDKASRDTVLVWDTLSSDIKRHEERHAEIARQYARKLESALEALHPQRDCKTMEARVEATSKQIIEAHAADQQRFDRVEAASFERRMIRMLRYKATQRDSRG